jgi:hypothetical protein
MKKSSIQKAILHACGFILFFFTSTAEADAQPVRFSQPDRIRSDQRWRFSAFPLVARKAQISKSADKYNIDSHNQIGAEFGFDYALTVKNDLCLLLGLHTGIFGRDLTFLIPGSEFGNLDRGDLFDNGPPSKTYEFLFIKLPLTLEKSWQIRAGQYFKLIAGTALAFGTKDGVTSNYRLALDGGGTLTFLTIDYTTNNRGKPWLNAFAGAGFEKLLKNNHFLQFNLIANYSPTYFIRGPYAFTVPNKPEIYGRYKVDGSYLGVQVSYSFALRRGGLL